ncbi:MAG: periplasmic heavy metal sensor [Thermoanaerobaculales bacterium]|nr:periplasmic heavy metal sensor [Thermoanaerobaculales bacterium]
MKRHIIIFLSVLTTATSLTAQILDLPPGKWWERPPLIMHLELTKEQQAAIQTLVYDHAHRMIDLNADVERTRLELGNQVDLETINTAAVRKAFAAFQDARRKLESERFEMTLSVRQTMSTEQWKKLLDLRDRLEGMKRMRDRPGADRQPDRRSPGARPPSGSPRGGSAFRP